MGWKDLGSYGNKIHETPNLDKLAERGMFHQRLRRLSDLRTVVPRL